MKKLIILFTACLLSLTMMACNNETVENKTEIINDKTIQVDALSKPDFKEMTRIEEDAVRTAIYGGPTQLTQDSQYVVWATARSTETFLGDLNQIFNKNDFVIDKVLKGDLQKGDLISVIEDGGVLSYQDYFDKVLTPIMESMGSVVEISDTFADATVITSPENCELIQENEQYLLFLVDSSIKQQAYTTIAGFTSRYHKNILGQYSRYSPDADFYPETDDKKIAQGYSTFFNSKTRNPSFTLEEIEKLVNESAQ